MSDKQLQTLGIIVTILLHAGVGTAVALIDNEEEEQRKTLLSQQDDFETIEAALAFKAPDGGYAWRKLNFRDCRERHFATIGCANAQGVDGVERPPVRFGIAQHDAHVRAGAGQARRSRGWSGSPSSAPIHSKGPWTGFIGCWVKTMASGSIVRLPACTWPTFTPFR